MRAVDYCRRSAPSAPGPCGACSARTPAPAGPEVAVERGGVTRFVNRSDITHIEAHGDYARLHTAGDPTCGPASTLEADWADGFVRIHRSRWSPLAHVREVRMDAAAARSWWATPSSSS